MSVAASLPGESLVVPADVTDAAATASTNGLCLPVDDAVLARLDRRERNYSRLDVSDRIDARGARVWTYVGTPEARARLRQGRRRE